MIEAEREEAERLAQLHVKESYGSEIGVHHWAAQTDYLAGYAAAVEAKETEMTKMRNACSDQGYPKLADDALVALDAERARSQKLFLKVMSARRSDSISKVVEYLDQAIAEYKSSAPSVEDLTKHGE